MVICTVEVNEKSPQTIVIGRRGTYNTQEIVFDIGYLIDAYGAGTAVLAIKRSQDSSAYPAVAAQDGNTLTWVVSEVDTYYVGAGVCQLMWYVDDGLAKTIIYPMVVMKDILSTAEDPPDGYENWIEHLTDLGAETLQNAQNAAQSASDAETAKDDAVDAKEAAEEAAEKAGEASVHAPVIQNGYWYIWNDGEYVDTGVRAEGQKGDKGDTGEKGDTGNGISKIEKTGTSGLVDTYTVTYTDGTSTTFTVTNGAKGDKGDTGATGNGIQSITKTGTSGNVDTYTITYTNGQTTTFTVTNGAVSSVAGKTGVVTLDANDVAFSKSGTYDDGTVGKELSDQKNAIGNLSDLETSTKTDLVSAINDVVESVLSGAIKAALLQIAQKVAYIDGDGEYYYSDLYNALMTTSISASYTQTGTVYEDDSLDTLRAGLTVTATYEDGTSETVTDYTLSGTLTTGTSTVTATYFGKTATFPVTVTAARKSDMNGWYDGIAYTDLTIVANEYAKAASGRIESYNGWDRTGYVPCNGAATITFPTMPQQATGRAISNWFYKQDKTPLSGGTDGFELSKSSPTTITVPENAYYFIISNESAALATCISNGIVPHE